MLLKNRNISSKIKISKVTDYAVLDDKDRFFPENLTSNLNIISVHVISPFFKGIDKARLLWLNFVQHYSSTFSRSSLRPPPPPPPEQENECSDDPGQVRRLVKAFAAMDMDIDKKLEL